MTSERSVMLAAGGTGGHLFPAFALAEELNRRGMTVDLMTDMRGDRYGSGFPARNIYQVPAATLAARTPASIAKTAFALGRGIKAAHGIMGAVRPMAVIGFGGYPTYPPLFAARLRGIATAIHEQNAVLGRANRMLARRVDAIATTFENVKGLDGPLRAKATLTGNPVRSIVVDAAAQPYDTPRADEGPLRLVVFGGSQGARYFSDTMPEALASLPDVMRRRLIVTQQAREEDLDRVRAGYASLGIAADVETFFKDLPGRLAGAHLIVARAGASTVTELAVIGRPSILVPLPHSLDGDQLNNALQLQTSGAAWCMEQKDLTPVRLGDAIAGLFATPGRLEAAAHAAKSVGRPDAVSRLADFVLALPERRAKQSG